MGRIEVLVLDDWDGLGPDAFEKVRARVVVADAFVDEWSATVHKPTTGGPVDRRMIAFDTSRLRNTEASGFAYRAGLLSYVAFVDDPQLNAPAALLEVTT